MLEIYNVEIDFQNNRLLYSMLSVTISKEEILQLVGFNGTGKLLY